MASIRTNARIFCTADAYGYLKVAMAMAIYIKKNDTRMAERVFDRSGQFAPSHSTSFLYNYLHVQNLCHALSSCEHLYLLLRYKGYSNLLLTSADMPMLHIQSVMHMLRIHSNIL